MVAVVTDAAGQAVHRTFFESDNSGLNRGTRQAERSIRRVDSAGNRMIRTFRQFNTVAFGLASGFGLVQLGRGATALTQIDDRVRSITNLLRAAGREGGLNEVISISNATFADLSATGTLTGRIASSTRDVGRAWSEVQMVVQAVNDSYRIGGVLTREARASAIQLAQALASGRFGGDERRAVLEGNPRLARAIAAGADIPFGDIRQAPLDAQVVFDAILNQAQTLNDEAARLTPTFEQAGNVFNTGLTLATSRLVTALDQALGIRDALVEAGEALTAQSAATPEIIDARIAALQALIDTANAEPGFLNAARIRVSTYEREIQLLEQLRTERAVAARGEAAQQRLERLQPRASELRGARLGLPRGLLTDQAAALMDAQDASFEFALQVDAQADQIRAAGERADRYFARLERAASDAAEGLERSLFRTGFGDVVRRQRNRQGADEVIAFLTQAQTARDEAFELAVSLNDVGEQFQSYRRRQEIEYNRLVDATRRVATSLEQSIFQGGFSDFLRRDRNRRGADAAINFAARLGPRRGPNEEELNRIFGAGGLTPAGREATEAARLLGRLPRGATPPVPEPTFFQSTAMTFFGNLNSALLNAVTSGNFQNIGDAFFASLTGALLGSVLDAASGAALRAIGVPGLARGGAFGPGPILVGEEGPELLVPRTSGVIIPNDRLGSMGGGDNYRIVIDALSDDALTQRIIALAPDLLRLARNQ